MIIRNKISGFTLIEVQLSLLILVLIVVVLMGGLKLAAKVTNTGEQVANQSTELRIITQLFKQQISSIAPLSTLEKGETKLIFKGENKGMYYIGYLPDKAITGGPWFIHLFQKKRQLILAYKIFDSTRSTQENMRGPFEQVILLDYIDDLSIHYQLQKSGWQAIWDDECLMPDLIKIELNQPQQQWPKIIVRLNSYAATKSRFHVLSVSD